MTEPSFNGETDGTNTDRLLQTFNARGTVRFETSASADLSTGTDIEVEIPDLASDSSGVIRF
ncbi:hypothetical protein HARCEL1_07730 [Halococcoides cellulosivorans]|uniref:Uncharacterized protein n=1 Tax=Halococcoides cellulosivorans TaxID=1679096 RepID=A0A2R4X1E6_9EURY|nr:hypothetical protein HARCEL1_07730 [Halococcoides cellulosivorans]